MTRQKGRSTSRGTRGSSMLIALAAALVCLMVVAVVLPAAVTALRRVDDDRSFRQENLALQSAAEIVSDELANMSYSYTKVQEEVYHAPIFDEEGNVTDSGGWETLSPVALIISISEEKARAIKSSPS